MAKQIDGFVEYLNKCMLECSNRIPVDFYENDSLQKNTLRIETLRDKCLRCGMKPPEQWHKDAKDRGWALWVYSGGSPSVFGSCDFHDCPLKDYFIRTAPKKAWRESV